MVWHRTLRPAARHLPDAQNVLTRLDAVVDRLEGAYQQWERLVPMLEEFSESLKRGGGE